MVIPMKITDMVPQPGADADDHRLFCGDLGNEVNDEVLTKAFTRFATFNMARVCALSSSLLLISWCWRIRHGTEVV